VKQGIDWWKTTPYGKQIEFIMLPENKGFGGGNNVGIKSAISDIVVCTQPDMLTFHDWVTPMRQMLMNEPKSLVGGRLIDFNGGWNSAPVKKGFVPYLEGFLIGAYADVWEKLGYFDERYFPCDCEDLCLSTTALANNYKLLSLNGEDYKHLSGGVIGTMNGEREKITINHRQLWLDKWEGKWERIGYGI
jgi:GT2 family glycosyltransferase